jgi:plasmid stabilization system protein ParE
MIGYTSNSHEALPREPEAVDEQTQAHFSHVARRRQEEQLREAWRRAHDGITGSLADFKRNGHPDRRLLSDVRVIERQVGRVDKRLGL